MSRWTDEELRELTTLWPTHSVLQIAKRLHRARAAIRSKARRLRLDGPPPHCPSEDVDAGDLAKRRPLKAANGHGRRRANQTHLSPDPTPDLTVLHLGPAIDRPTRYVLFETNSQQACLAISRDFNVQISK